MANKTECSKVDTKTHADVLSDLQAKLRQIEADAEQLAPDQVAAIAAEVDSMANLTAAWRYADIIDEADFYTYYDTAA